MGSEEAVHQMLGPSASSSILATGMMHSSPGPVQSIGFKAAGMYELLLHNPPSDPPPHPTPPASTSLVKDCMVSGGFPPLRASSS